MQLQICKIASRVLDSRPFFENEFKAISLQDQALPTELVGVVSLATAGALQKWLDSCEERKANRLTTPTERKHMKTKKSGRKTAAKTPSVMTAAAKIAVAIMTSMCASCLLP